MTKATDTDGALLPIADCYILIPELGNKRIVMNNLPDISDGKQAGYTNTSGIGRTMPFKSYSNSDDRTINWTIHFIVCKQTDVDQILGDIKALEACVYPRTNVGGTTYAPPPICRLRCGNTLAGGFPKKDTKPEVCAILKSYSIKFDPSVPWDASNLIPYKMDMDLQFELVYDQSKLPGAELILTDGY
mgnify:CR=1 FL=1